MRLGHWKRSRWLGKLESDAAVGFFISPRAIKDPRAELEAEVREVYSSVTDENLNIRCRFPARTRWLIQRLGIDLRDLPQVRCAKFDEWKRLMDAGSASLIFASAYLNNPSSMFGHTFLRIERKSIVGEPLRDNTLNFAADTGTDSGGLYAVKGLLGLFPGRYTAMPYYMKIAEYGNIESRDLWEYRLALSSSEVDRLVDHAWEMGAADFPYFFFSKNCSYQLMPALEAAAPRISLLSGSPAIVSPVDTLIAAKNVSGLIAGVEYRPSHATVMTQRRKLMSPPEKRAAEAYAKGNIAEGDRLTAAMVPTERAIVLDSAMDHILYSAGFSPDVPDPIRELERPILIRRAKIPELSKDLSKPSWAIPPDEGHLRHRLMIGEGARRGGTFTEIAWRPGYHDLLDRQEGYPPGAGVEGLSWRLRYDHDEKHLYLRDFRLIEILSATPWDSWTRKPAWSAGTGFDSAFNLGKSASRSSVYEGHGGMGFATEPIDGTNVFGIAQIEGAAGSGYQDGWTAGGGLRFGISTAIGREVRGLIDGVLSARMLGDRTPDHRLRLGLNWAPKRDISLRTEGLLRGPHRELGVYATLYH